MASNGGGSETAGQLVSGVEYQQFGALVDGHPAGADHPPVSGRAQTAGAGVDTQEGQPARSGSRRFFGGFALFAPLGVGQLGDSGHYPGRTAQSTGPSPRLLGPHALFLLHI